MARILTVNPKTRLASNLICNIDPIQFKRQRKWLIAAVCSLHSDHHLAEATIVEGLVELTDEIADVIEAEGETRHLFAGELMVHGLVEEIEK